MRSRSGRQKDGKVSSPKPRPESRVTQGDYFYNKNKGHRSQSLFLQRPKGEKDKGNRGRKKSEFGIAVVVAYRKHGGGAEHVSTSKPDVQ